MNPFALVDDAFFAARKALRLKAGGVADTVSSSAGQIMAGMYVAGTLATAPKGHLLSRAVGLPFAFGLNAIAPGPLTGLAGFALGEKIGDAFQYTVDSIDKSRRLKFGGDYKDTAVAYTMRQKAAQELGGSLLNARQWLGKESILMHQ